MSKAAMMMLVAAAGLLQGVQASLAASVSGAGLVSKGELASDVFPKKHHKLPPLLRFIRGFIPPAFRPRRAAAARSRQSPKIPTTDKEQLEHLGTVLDQIDQKLNTLAKGEKTAGARGEWKTYVKMLEAVLEEMKTISDCYKHVNQDLALSPGKAKALEEQANELNPDALAKFNADAGNYIKNTFEGEIKPKIEAQDYMDKVKTSMEQLTADLGSSEDSEAYASHLAELKQLMTDHPKESESLAMSFIKEAVEQLGQPVSETEVPSKPTSEKPYGVAVLRPSKPGSAVAKPVKTVAGMLTSSQLVLDEYYQEALAPYKEYLTQMSTYYKELNTWATAQIVRQGWAAFEAASGAVTGKAGSKKAIISKALLRMAGNTLGCAKPAPAVTPTEPEPEPEPEGPGPEPAPAPGPEPEPEAHATDPMEDLMANVSSPETKA